MRNKVFIGQMLPEYQVYPHAEDGFCPSINYPEYPFLKIAEEFNAVYDMLRESFRALRLDAERYGTQEWNPLGDIINIGDTVLIKPNMVMHKNEKSTNGLECLITHPSLVRAVLDYVLLALKGTGKIIVADAPMQSCDFAKMMENSGYNQILQFYQNEKIDIQFVDLRNYITKCKDGVLFQQEVVSSNKSIAVDLGSASLFWGKDERRYRNLRITNYEPAIMNQHHNKDKNEYLISKAILDADVIINMPKPKTHRKAGVTISLKNMVGINTNKEWLPHHTKGSVSEKGDEYLYPNAFKRLIAFLLDSRNHYSAQKQYSRVKIMRFACGIARKLAELFSKDNYTEGSWYGNDTTWRTILDLNMVVRYADKSGYICDQPQRKIFNIADMVISGEGEGPLLPTPKKLGIIAVAQDSVCMDEVLSTLMGFDYRFIPSISNARNAISLGICKQSEAIIVSNVALWDGKRCDQLKNEEVMHFIPSSGWKNYKDKIS